MRVRARLWKLIAYPICTLLVALALVQAWFLAQVLYWRDNNADMTSFMELRLEAMRERDRNAKLQHRWVDYRRISIHLKRAIIAAEDAKFIDHEGFDWEGIQRALERNQRRGQYVAGGLHHQPAAREEPVPLGRAQPAAQDAGGRDHG